MTTGFSGRLGEVAQEAVGAKAATDFLIVEYDPAQRLPAVVLAAWQKSSGVLGQIVEDYGGLAEFAGGVDEHGRLAHFVDRRTVGGGAGFAVEEIEEYRLPVGADEIEHQGGAIGVAGLGETIELIVGHRMSSARVPARRRFIGRPRAVERRSLKAAAGNLPIA
jgi:hypothetical protein